MKRINTSIFIALISLFATGGCSSNTLNCDDSETKTFKQSLNGNINRITSYSSVDIVYRVGEPQIVVSGPAYEVNRFKILEKGSNLDLRSSGNSYRKGSNSGCPVTITISLPDLQGITLSGSGDFNASKISTSSLEINLTGAGDITLGDVSSTSMTVNISGAGNFRAQTIDVTYLQFLCRGAGDIDINKVQATTFKTALYGSGDVKINRLDGTSAEVNLAGAGDLKFQGLSLNLLYVMLSGTGDITLEGKCSKATLKVAGVGEIDARKLKVDFPEKVITGLGEINL